MFTDYHTHILPGIDDGAKNTVTSLSMLEALASQGVERVVATPHFYAHRESSVERFLEKRQAAFNKICKQTVLEEIRLGAEVSLEVGISDVKGIEKLAIEGTNLILLEPSYHGFKPSMLDEIHNIASEYGLTPIIAHVHRYAALYSESEFDKLLEINGIFQVNADAFSNRIERKIAKSLIKNGERVIFGSDCHNLSQRKPNMDYLLKKTRKFKDCISESNDWFERYRIG